MGKQNKTSYLHFLLQKRDAASYENVWADDKRKVKASSIPSEGIRAIR